ncbi:hypothetical protein OYT13_16755 [Pandoraea sp. XJJ-1]|uniref:HGGxSTG domain-containing protein n=1 Tax=Pandoraea sp. XJJ-1 TaxID=3002643 RepID=UPI0022819C3B|nr:HGGxSTG domain-containing protein [Pandoraea sp. XJJ-1]WAL81490.1 hypothetical protein OYT13_16755 [Pandoraea sp. XJJ-1]
MARLCGAKTRSGATCKNGAMANGRCRMHGGKTPQTNQNAAKPGSLYSKYLTPEEQAQFDQIELGRVDDELRLTRIRLARALGQEQEKGGTLEVDSAVKRQGGGPQVAAAELHTKRRDYVGIIDRLTARIESLERTRAELMKDAPPGGDDDLTRDDTVILKPDEPIPENPVV